jgi:tetratricopeptide (TPR) repeat protein
LELKPKSRRALSSLGRLERLLGDLDESERLLRKAIAIDSKHVASLQELANTLKMKKEFSEAHALEKKVTRLNASYRSQLKRVKSTEILID